jgi:hypothetical protein
MMMFEEAGRGPAGQRLVFDAWRSRLNGRSVLRRMDLDLSGIVCELAHVSLLASEAGRICFRLAGTGLRHAFGRELKGISIDELPPLAGRAAWGDSVQETLTRMRPVAGRSILEDGRVHFWMRLPMSSDGARADLALCHDRFLSSEALSDPDRAARAADRLLRIDLEEVQAA